MIKFQEADIAQVLEIYQELTGRTVLKPNSLPATKITIRSQTPLTRAEAVHALDSILAMNQVAMTPQGEKFVKAQAAADAGTGAAIFYTGSATNLPEAGVYVTTMVQLKNAQPNDLVPVLQPFSKAPNSILTIPSTSMLILRDYAENVKRMVEIIDKIDVVPVQEFESVVIPIKYALASDIVTVLGNLTSSGSTTTVGAQQSRTGLSGGVGGFGGGGSGGFGNRQGGLPGSPGYNPNQPYGQQAQQSGLGGAGGANRSSFQQRLQNIVNRAGGSGGSSEDIYVLGQTKIIADERINALLIFANKSDLITISNIIAKLDVVLPQVLIEAVVLEVNLNNNLSYGFSYLQSQPATIGSLFTGIGAIKSPGVPFLNVNNLTNGAGDGFTYAARIFDLDAAVIAVAGDGRGKILQRPRIQTSHAREANLFVGQSRPYPTTSYYGGGAFGGYSSIQQLQIGVTLSVLPLVNADGLVVMEIRQKVESYDGDVTIQNVGDVPITSQKEANAYVAVRDGETIMLGGFISNEKSKSHGGIPILKDIPLLGNLFRSTKETDARRELLVLIRPTVLPTPESASTFASEERTRLPGTKEAEYDFIKSEKKLLEDTNRRLEQNMSEDKKHK
jgi:general secretion pathway protein D